MVIPVDPSQFETALKSLQSSCVNKCTSLAVRVPFIFAINLPLAELTSRIFACGRFLSRCNCRRVRLDVIFILVPARESRLWRGLDEHFGED